MNISLPKALKKKVETVVEADHYSTPSEYVRTLIREDIKRRKEQKGNKKTPAN
ncbi:MAG: hypothetical protein F6K14_08555 [Symploca sp. SIO2C1]|nr:hypothetical protein [Symploca sp. SIO2C1]